MKAMTWPPEARTRAAETTGAMRRRTVPPTGTVRRPAPRATAPRATAPQGPFAVLVVGLLGGALAGLLLLNTALAQQSFTRSELQRENQRLDERRQGLQEDIAREDGPEVLHAKARRLGMRDAGAAGARPSGPAGRHPIGPRALVPSR
jgi:hypothetical protein